MPDFKMQLNLIEELIFEFSENGTLTTDSGSTFVAPLRQLGPLFYLHRIFRGCTKDELDSISGPRGFRPPLDYLAFMKFSDGAILFDNTFFVFGTRENLSRDIDPEKLTPPNLRTENTDYERRTGDSERLCVGSVVGDTKRYFIVIRPDGNVLLRDEGRGTSEFSTFFDCILTVAAKLRSISNAQGLLDDTGLAVETQMQALLSPS